jgi:hypothetical protein
MSNPIQTSNNGHQWHNDAFAAQFDSITARLPSQTFYAILFSYIATAGLNCYAIHLPLFLSVPLSLAIQSLRYLSVFTPFLNPHGRASHLPEVIALGASLLALFELSFSLLAMGKTGNEFWSLMLFGSAIVVLSMILEIQFIAAGKKAFGLTGEKKPIAGGAVSMVNQQQPAIPTPLPAAPVPNVDVQAYKDEIEFLKNQLAAHSNLSPTGDILPQTEQQTPPMGNGKPGRPKKQIPQELLNGHSSNGNGKH